MREPLILGAPQAGSAQDGEFGQAGRERGLVAAKTAKGLRKVPQLRRVHPDGEGATRSNGRPTRTQSDRVQQCALRFCRARFVNQCEAWRRALWGHMCVLEDFGKAEWIKKRIYLKSGQAGELVKEFRPLFDDGGHL